MQKMQEKVHLSQFLLDFAKPAAAAVTREKHEQG